MKTDHWFYGLFQSAPDLITLLLPGDAAGEASSLGPDAPGDALYRFEAPELEAVNHRLDGALWPRDSEIGTPEQPVVLLEVQLHAMASFKHRLFAQAARFLQLNPQVLHLLAKYWQQCVSRITQAQPSEDLVLGCLCYKKQCCRSAYTLHLRRTAHNPWHA